VSERQRANRWPSIDLAINRLRRQRPIDVERFLAEHDAPIVEGRYCTFVYRGEADEVLLVQRITGRTDRLPLRRVPDTDLWYIVLGLAEGSRLDYQLQVRRGDHVEQLNDPLNPRRSHGPFGGLSVCFGPGYTTPEWTQPDPAAPPGVLTDLVVGSRALGRDCAVTMYLPASFQHDGRYPLLVVHDGGDFLQYAAAKTVLDNLIHRGDLAATVVAFLHPKDRLTEYADSPEHARFLTDELLPQLTGEYPLTGQRCLLGASFGAVASLSAAVRAPGTYASLILLSGSFVFTDGGQDHRGGPVFEPVATFVDAYRRRPTRAADRLFLSCGVYEPLIVRNRAMRPIFESTGMAVRYVEARDGHTWENWRDRLRDALSWAIGPRRR
jgi:enterochelin esterase family protein